MFQFNDILVIATPFSGPSASGRSRVKCAMELEEVQVRRDLDQSAATSRRVVFYRIR